MNNRSALHFRAPWWAILFVVLTPALASGATLISKGSVWSYLDNGSDQGIAWRAPGFDDSAWVTGLAEFGYGDGDESTVVSFGPNSSSKYVTTYFRRHFQVANPSQFTGLTLNLRRDDGAVVYLNGQEVRRDNMPAGAVGYLTLAAADTSSETTYFSTNLSTSVLVPGDNVIAVEIHQYNRSSSDISFNLELIGNEAASGPALLRGPYLQTGTPTGIIVRWRTDVATDGRVSVGTSPTSPNLFFDNAAVTTEHEVQVSGLSPQTRYYYSVGSTAQSLSGGDSSTFFETAPPTGARRATRVWVIGDSGTADASATAVYNAYRNFTGSNYTHLWLMLGDNAYNDGTDQEYQNAVFDMYPQMLRQTVLWPTLGNHDGSTADSQFQSGPYYDIFTLPRQAEAGGYPSHTEAYYSFDYGNIHFVVLDSHETDRSPGGAMLTWLQSDLQTTTADWIIAFWHHPPYSKGSHDSDAESQLVQMRQNVLPILENYGVDLVLTGHSHSYERSKFIDGHYGSSSTFSDALHVKVPGSGRTDNTGAYTKPDTRVSHAGAVYAVAGSSGEVAGGPLNHPAMYLSLNELGSVILDVDGLTLNARFLNNNGTTRDYFTIVKGTVAPTSNINGLAWQDANNNGIRETDESFLQNIEVRLYTSINSLVGTTSTGANGAYQFASVATGNYYVQFIPGSLQFSPQDQGANDAIDSDVSPIDGRTSIFVTSGGSNIANVDAGMHLASGTPQTVNLRNGLNGYAGTDDTYVASGLPTRGFGASTTLKADAIDGTNGRYIALLKWNVSQIPASAAVTDAKLTLRVTNISNGSYGLYAVNTAWGESDATWNSVNPLNNAGELIGTMVPSTLSSKLIQLNSAGISLVQGWVSGSVANNGIMIVDGGTSDGTAFRSSEYGTQSQRPTLTVTYQ